MENLFFFLFCIHKRKTSSRVHFEYPLQLSRQNMLAITIYCCNKWNELFTKADMSLVLFFFYMYHFIIWLYELCSYFSKASCSEINLLKKNRFREWSLCIETSFVIDSIYFFVILMRYCFCWCWLISWFHAAFYIFYLHFHQWYL